MGEEPALPVRSNSIPAVSRDPPSGLASASTGIDLSLVMSRIGHILLGVKDVFDKRAVGGKLTIEGCTGESQLLP